MRLEVSRVEMSIHLVQRAVLTRAKDSILLAGDRNTWAGSSPGEELGE